MTLKQAAEVFSSFDIPAWIDDGTKVGEICGVNIHAGEVRRLREALNPPEQNPEQELRAEIESLLRQRNLIGAVRLYRDKTGLYLKDAKQEVEKIGVELGLRKVDVIANYWPQTPLYTWK
jgi:ribosomal protein L7/L12